MLSPGKWTFPWALLAISNLYCNGLPISLQSSKSLPNKQTTHLWMGMSDYKGVHILLWVLASRNHIVELWSVHLAYLGGLKNHYNILCGTGSLLQSSGDHFPKSIGLENCTQAFTIDPSTVCSFFSLFLALTDTSAHPRTPLVISLL